MMLTAGPIKVPDYSQDPERVAAAARVLEVGGTDREAWWAFTLRTDTEALVASALTHGLKGAAKYAREPLTPA
jgi:hypothetical protein